jgi:DNA (cytosine-5)-methyltransferase 1
MMPEEKLTHLSLFSGIPIGGIDLAAHWAGFETVQFVERDQFCQKVLAKNFPGVPIHDDITTFDATKFNGQLDLVSAGFPCQPHSLAGKRKASGDERDLWGEVVRVLGESQPTWFLGENVAGLLSSESGHFFGRIINDLALLGYRVGWCRYGASDIGATHQRERVFIVANANSKPEPQSNQTNGTKRKKRNTRESACGSFRPIADRNWQSWDIEPTVCMPDDGVCRELATSQLTALGNAVVPQQVYVLLKAIAETYTGK